MEVKIISWNIFQGKFLNKVISFLEKSRADIICLQEVVAGAGQNVAAEIARKLGFNFVYFKAFTTDRHTPAYDLGNAILTRFKVEKNAVFFLSDSKQYKKNSQTEPRIAISADIKINKTASLHVVNTHLAYSAFCKSCDIRNSQVNRLSKLISGRNTVLAGDFNSQIDSPEIKKLSKILVNAGKNTKGKTWSIYSKEKGQFTRENLKYRIDHIFTSPDLKVESFKIEKVKASDHLPVTITLAI